VGLALVVGGVVCGVLAQNASNTITQEAQSRQPFDYNTFQSGKTDQAVEIALLAIGGAAVISGAMVMILGKRQITRAHASLAPLVRTHAAGLGLGGTF
jgi:hypothetical protein